MGIFRFPRYDFPVLRGGFLNQICNKKWEKLPFCLVESENKGAVPDLPSAPNQPRISNGFLEKQTTGVP